MKKFCVTLFTIFILVFTGCAPQQAYTATLTGMGTVISYKIYGEGKESAFLELSEKFDELEDACSLTRGSSAINALNETGSTDNIHIIQQAEAFLELYLKTDGRFDCTVGGLTTLWNIGFENAKKPDEHEIQEALLNVDASEMVIEDNFLTVAKGQKMDLGATAKGYALDKAKEILDKNKISGAVITVGGSVLFYGKNPQNGNWTCAVKDPFDTSEFLGTFKINEGFVSTSGSYERFFEENGEVYHHILDPLTGYPAESDVVSVTVICDNGLLSDALSTVAFILGSKEGAKILKEYNAQGIFVEKNGEITVVGDIEFEKA